MLFNHQDIFYFIQKIQCKGKPDKYNVFHKYAKDLSFEEVKAWSEKLKNFNNSVNYANYKCSSLQDSKLPYNKILSMNKVEAIDSLVDTFSTYSIDSNKNKYVVEIKSDKEIIFKIREFLKLNKVTYMVYSHKDNKYGIIILFKSHHKSIMQELCLMVKCSENYLYNVVDHY